MLLPLLPLRDLVVFPHMVAPLFVGRTKSVNALADAMNKDKLVFLSTQKKANVDNPGETDINHIGTIGKVLQLPRLPPLDLGDLAAVALEAALGEATLVMSVLRLASVMPMPPAEDPTTLALSAPLEAEWEALVG